ncbi:hypothetical protein DIPPA_24623 [Diplonema papillatum]|nr:hypothetical protein DIPPA_24623 [Diplonema papillatum]
MDGLGHQAVLAWRWFVASWVANIMGWPVDAGAVGNRKQGGKPDKPKAKEQAVCCCDKM